MRFAETRFFAAEADADESLREQEPELISSSQVSSSPARKLSLEETEYARDKRERANSSSYRG
jgi:hypothetical protein